MFQKTQDPVEIERRHDIASKAVIVFLLSLIGLIVAFCSPHGTTRVFWLVLDVAAIVISLSVAVINLATVPAGSTAWWIAHPADPRRPRK